MNDRRIKTLELLARVERGGLVKIAERQAEISAKISEKKAEAEMLAGRIENEASVTSAEMAAYVGAFISTMRIEIHYSDTSRKLLEHEAAALEEELRERFRRLKVLELTAENDRHEHRCSSRRAAEVARQEAMLLSATNSSVMRTAMRGRLR
jgi:hypothetical protein